LPKDRIEHLPRIGLLEGNSDGRIGNRLSRRCGTVDVVNIGWFDEENAGCDESTRRPIR